jgi:hypothetical protein
MITTTHSLDEQVGQIRGFLERYFCQYEDSSPSSEQRKLALHKLNSDLFVLGPLLPDNENPMTYEDLRLRFIGTIFDPVHETDIAVQEVKSEFYSYLDATAYSQCATGNPASTQAP